MTNMTMKMRCFRRVLSGMLLLSAMGLSAADDYQLIVSGTWPVASSASVSTAVQPAVTIGSQDEAWWTFSVFTSVPFAGLVILFR